eukprot:g13477.t1
MRSAFRSTWTRVSHADSRPCWRAWGPGFREHMLIENILWFQLCRRCDLGLGRLWLNDEPNPCGEPGVKLGDLLREARLYAFLPWQSHTCRMRRAVLERREGQKQNAGHQGLGRSLL